MTIEREDMPTIDVSFRIMHEALEPSVVSSALNIQPTDYHRKGEARVGITKKGKIINYAPHSIGLWQLDSPLPKTASLDDHLDALLNWLAPARDRIEELVKEGYRVDIFCGYFVSCYEQTSISLKAEMLKRISSFSIDLGVVTYCVGD